MSSLLINVYSSIVACTWICPDLLARWFLFDHAIFRTGGFRSRRYGWFLRTLERTNGCYLTVRSLNNRLHIIELHRKARFYAVVMSFPLQS